MTSNDYGIGELASKAKKKNSIATDKLWQEYMNSDMTSEEYVERLKKIAGVK